MDISQVSDLNNFILDVFCHNILADVQDVDSIFNIEKACLDYAKLMDHPRLRRVIMCVYTYKNLIGFFPSSLYVHRVLDSFGDDMDINMLINRFINDTFLQFISQSPNIAKSVDKTRVTMTRIMYDIANSRISTKKLIWDWLSRDLSAPLDIGNTSLFTAYREHIIQRRLEKTECITYRPKISQNRLDWTDTFFSVPYMYDADAMHVHQNFHYFRSIFGRRVIFCDTEHISKLSKIADAIATSFSQRVVVAIDYDNYRNIENNLKSNTMRIDPRFVPINFATVAYNINNTSISDLGTTTRVIPINFNISAPASQTWITDKSFAKQIIKDNIDRPICVPFFTFPELTQTYIKMLESLDIKNQNYEQELKRILTYQSLITMLPQSNEIPMITNKNANNAVFLLDTRENPLSIASIFVAFSNLHHNTWSLVIATNPDSKAFYERFFPNAHYITDIDCLSTIPFDIEACNVFMKSADLWTRLGQYNHILIVQDDGILVRPGLEDSPFINYTYVGAPWAPCASNKEVMLLTNNKMVGNGGLCLRDVNEMLCIARDHKIEGETLFHHHLQPIQEDVFYAHYASKTPNTIEEASLFSTEQILNTKSLGFHKFWMYHSFEQVIEFLKNIYE